ncbi:MAG: ABC transporter transmembrane domain-containing protein [Desulfuromonadaceae bacterium]|nr:ABC transporter transmembrane domain-containing protein [Desulfuromonadaceae bacterium]
MAIFKRLVLYMKPYWWRILIAGLASSAYGGLDAAFAYMVEPLLKKIFVTKDMFIFTILPFAIILIFIFRATTRYLNDYFMRTAAQLAVQDVRNEIFKKNVYLDLSFFNRNQAGSLMSRVVSDVSTMQDGVGGLITGVFRDALGLITLLGVIFYRDWQLALISILVIPLTIYPAGVLGKKIKLTARKGQDEAGLFASILQETLSGIKVVKAFSLEEVMTERFKAANQKFYSLFRKTIKYSALSSPVMEIITSLGIGAVIFYGGSKVMANKMTAPEFFSFITAMALVYSPLKKLINAYNEMQRCIGASERVFEIIDAVPTIIDAEDASILETKDNRVEFKNVYFKYQDEFILNNVSLVAEKGEMVALVGPSGGGKTTLVSLIARFFDATNGQITIGSHDVREIKKSSLMNQIALVDQETILFHDTIANNIRYGRPGASDEDLTKAAKAAYAEDFIMAMPEGYQTEIGDRGVRLSGGQRQRICIARAILKNAPILILDEATSALDTESEQMVQKALDNLMTNRTTFVIAHRLSTVLHADKIIVLENGRIVERGTHKELIKSEGLYSRLCARQFGDDLTAIS